LQLATFLNDAGLEATGNNLFMESAASGPATAANPAAPGYGVIMQGYTEASNVDPVSEITNLIVAQRAYEMNSKVVTTADQMLSTANNTKS
jgi:flagellar basal-body rod protein FlgG